MISINLLPPELKLHRINAKRNASLVSVCIVVVLFTIVLAIVGESAKNTIKDYLDSAKSDVQKNTSQLDQYQDLQDLAYQVNDRATATDKINQTRLTWSQVLLELANSTPVDVQFETLTINGEKSPNFVLLGNTTTEREIIKFKEKLENSPVFKNVSFKSASLNQNQSDASKSKLSFTIDFDLEIKGSKAVSGSFSTSPDSNLKNIK